jgi:hypothetical protein
LFREKGFDGGDTFRGVAKTIGNCRSECPDPPERLEVCGGELPENDPLVAAVVRR